ncbi:MAG: P-II family nitrogen regulator [Candidatus Phosphoribacter sp.]|nr:P-II family nitrogen regulator [Actinomycetales bacterium]
MHFKLIIVAVEDGFSEKVVQAARAAGATGATVLNQARGEGLDRPKTFFGLDLVSQRDVIFLLVEQHLARRILEHIADVAGFDRHPGRGIAFQLDVEDAVGIIHQATTLRPLVEEEV